MEPIAICVCKNQPFLNGDRLFGVVCPVCGRQGPVSQDKTHAIQGWNFDRKICIISKETIEERDNATKHIKEMEARFADQAAVLNATVDHCNALEEKCRRLQTKTDELQHSLGEADNLIMCLRKKLKETESLHEGAEKAYERQGEHVEQLLDTNEELLNSYKLAGRVEEENQRLKTQVAGLESELVHVRDELKRANQQRRSQAEAEEYAGLRAHVDRLATENRYLHIENDKTVSRLGRMIVACPHDRACLQGGSK